MKNLIYAILIISLTSCMTESKVSKYMRDNKEFSSKECQTLFPIQETKDTATVYDSVNYFWAYNNVIIALDSTLDAFEELRKKCGIKDTGRINIDSIKSEIKKSLKPCVTKERVITKTLIDTRETERLTIQRDKARADVDKYAGMYEKERSLRIEAENSLSNAKASAAKAYSLLILVIIIALVVIFRKFLAPVASAALTFISKILKP